MVRGFYAVTKVYFKGHVTPHEQLRFADVVLVVDVLRAMTTATALFDRGLRTLIPADSLGAAQKLRRGDDILVGEAGGSQPEAFDFGNSPVMVRGGNFRGRTAVLTTSNGTRAAHSAAGSSDKVLLARLNNATAAYQLGWSRGWLKRKSPSYVRAARVKQARTIRTLPEHSRLGSSAWV